MSFSALRQAQRRKRERLAAVKAKAIAGRPRIDVRRPGEPMPVWPDERTSDYWLVIDLSEAGC